MATLKRIKRSRRSESLSKGFMVDTVRGVLRVRKWPRKRGTPKSASQRWWNDWFKQANRLAKYVDAATARRAIDLTAGTGKYPRDIILQAMRGRLYSWQDQNGKKWRPMAAIQDISDSLDVLVQDVGSILCRFSDRWRALAGGSPGEVLTYMADDTPPEWQPASGGGGSLGGALVYMSAAKTLTNNTWANLPFASEEYDTAGIHDPVTNNDRLIVPAGYDRVELTAGCYMDNFSNGQRVFEIQKNGLGAVGCPAERQAGSVNVDPVFNLKTAELVVVPTDYFTVRCYQNRGGNLDVAAVNQTFFSMKLLKAI